MFIKILKSTNQGPLNFIWKALLIDIIPSLTIAIMLVPLLNIQSGTNTVNHRFPIFIATLILAPWAETAVQSIVVNFFLKKTKNPIIVSSITGIIFVLYHRIDKNLGALLVFWPFFVYSMSLITWGEKSRWDAIRITSCLHMCHNAIPAFFILAY